VIADEGGRVRSDRGLVDRLGSGGAQAVSEERVPGRRTRGCRRRGLRTEPEPLALERIGRQIDYFALTPSREGSKVDLGAGQEERCERFR
jgi:hypothetical protein